MSPLLWRGWKQALEHGHLPESPEEVGALPRPEPFVQIEVERNADLLLTKAEKQKTLLGKVSLSTLLPRCFGATYGKVAHFNETHKSV